MANSNFFKTKRAALLASSALAGLAGVTVAPSTALAACAQVGNTVTCSGPSTGNNINNQAANFNNLTVTIIAPGATFTELGDAVNIEGDANNPHVSVIYTENAPTTITSVNADGIDIETSDGGGGFAGRSITVTTNGGSQIFAGDNGMEIDITGGASTGDISIESNGAIVADDDGIDAANAGSGSLTITNNGRIGFNSITNTIVAVGDAGIRADTNGGALNVTNNGTINSTNDGLLLDSDGGAVQVTTAVNSSITSNNADGMDIESDGGAVTVTHNGVLTGDDDGIDVNADGFFGGGAVTVDNNGTITATNNNGIEVTSFGFLGNGGDITVNHNAGAAINAFGGNGIDVASSSFFGDGGVVNVNLGAGSTINALSTGVNASSSSFLGNGGPVTVTGGGSTITVIDPLGVAVGIDADSSSFLGDAGPVNVNLAGDTVNVAGLAAAGVVASGESTFGYGGDVNVTTDAATVINAAGLGAIGIDASSRSFFGNSGNVTVINDGDINATALASFGISAFSGTVLGDAGNANAINDVNGDVNVVGVAAVGVAATTGSLVGYGGNAFADNAGRINVDSIGGAGLAATSITLLGPGGQAIAWNEAGGSISVTGDLTIGMSALAGGWTDPATGLGAFAYAQNDGLVFSSNGIGISSVGVGPGATATVFNGGQVWAVDPDLGYGIFARTYLGGSDVTVVNTGLVNGSFEGIHAEVSSIDGGAIRVGNGGFLDTATNTWLSPLFGPAQIAPVTTAVINSQGDGIHAEVDANIGTGGVEIQNWGTVNAGQSAIQVDNLNPLSETLIRNNGTLFGDGSTIQTAVIAIDPDASGFAAPTTIINGAGALISANNASPSAFAIATGSLFDGAVTITNNAGGTIRGRVDLTNNADTFTNNGLWESRGTSRFYGGNDRINNNGVIRTIGTTTFDLGTGNDNRVNNNANGVIQVRNDGIVDGNATFSAPGGVLTFNNAGTIDMWDQQHRVTNTTTVNGTFNAVGNNGLVLVDTQLAGIGSLSDRLIVNGNTTGGVTSLRVLDTTPGLGAWNPVGTTIVSISGNEGSGGFVLDPFSSNYFGGVLQKGLYDYALGVGPGVGCEGAVCYTLYSAPSAAAYRLPVAITGAQQIFQDTNATWEDRQTELRDQVLRSSVAVAPYSAGADLPSRKAPILPPPPPPVGGFSTWIKALGAWTDRTNNFVTFAGPIALGRDLSYKQNSWGVMGGLNYATGNWWGGDVNVGILGGYLQSYLNFNAGPNWRYEGGTVGVSATYINRGFFVDGLFKADLLNLQAGIPFTGGTAFTNASTTVNTVGGVWNVGYNYVWRQFFVEPSVTLTYSSTQIGNLNTLGALGALVRFGSGEDFRGGFGGRVGYSWPSFFAGHLLEASVTGRVWDQFNSNGGRTVDIVSGGIGQTLGDFTYGSVYGEVKGNLQLLSAGPGWGAYLSGGAKFNDYFTTWTARGGISYRW